MTQTPEDTARANFAARAEHYVTSATHADPQRLARIVEMTMPRPGWRALDVATGTGHTAFAFAPAVAWVVAVDLTAEMLKQAERMRKDRGYGNVELQVADVHALPFPDASFDLVTSRRAPHHFSDIDRALREMRRVLKPGGRLMIDDRSSPEDDAVDDVLHRLDTLHDRSHVRQYRPSRWRQMLAAAGFDVVAVEEYRASRPLSAYTKDVVPADVAEIERVVAGLDQHERDVLQMKLVDGEVHLDHFYVTVVADRA